MKVSDEEFMLQRDVVAQLNELAMDDWPVVFAICDQLPYRLFGIWSWLVPKGLVEVHLKDVDAGDLKFGGGLPELDAEGKYLRWGAVEEGVRPFVIYRTFSGIYAPSVELCEEFRHYHNLAQKGIPTDCESKQREEIFVWFDESGHEHEVAKLSGRLVGNKAWGKWHFIMRVQRTFLMRFLAGTQACLIILVDSGRRVPKPLSALSCQKDETVDGEGTIIKYSLAVWVKDGRETVSRLLAKVVLFPPPVNKCGKWPSSHRETEKVDFIVGTNTDGSFEKKNVAFLSSVAREDALIPVYFKREVLGKYYQDPERYTVDDGYLSCVAGWGMPIDNDRDDYVVVFLTDLAVIPYCELLHWKQFNVAPPYDRGVSETCWRRSFMCQSTEPQMPDLLFRYLYQKVKNDWQSKFGWELFKELAEKDKYLCKTIRIPVTNSQDEFDDQIQALDKLLREALNTKEIESRVPKDEWKEKEKKDKKGKAKEQILKLGVIVQELGATQGERENITTFLCDLYDLRSTGSAHLKGSKYERVRKKLGLTDDNKEDMKRLLLRAVEVLRILLRVATNAPKVTEESE